MVLHKPLIFIRNIIYPDRNYLIVLKVCYVSFSFLTSILCLFILLHHLGFEIETPTDLTLNRSDNANKTVS